MSGNTNPIDELHEVQAALQGVKDLLALPKQHNAMVNVDGLYYLLLPITDKLDTAINQLRD